MVFWRWLVLVCALCVQTGMAAERDVGLPGVVNATCDSAQSREPVVLIHGTFAHTRRAFSTLAPTLKADGLCLFALNYGKHGKFSTFGMADIEQSKAQLSAFIQDVLRQTGAQKVTLIGHSQGGLLAFLLARSPALTGRVARIVAVAPSIRGTTRVADSFLARYCPACMQQATDSSLVTALNEGNINPPGVRTLILATQNDKVVTPVHWQFVHEPGVTNVLLQERHPKLTASHSGLMHVPEATALIRDFLDAP